VCSSDLPKTPKPQNPKTPNLEVVNLFKMTIVFHPNLKY